MFSRLYSSLTVAALSMFGGSTAMAGQQCMEIIELYTTLDFFLQEQGTAPVNGCMRQRFPASTSLVEGWTFDEGTFAQGDPEDPSSWNATSGLALAIEDCYNALHAEGYAIYATALHADSVSLYEKDYTGKVALVFGNEQRGVSEAAIAGADGVIIIPMVGVVESLNISVACSVTLYEAMRQRLAAGTYDAPRLESEAFESLYQQWLTR